MNSTNISTASRIVAKLSTHADAFGDPLRASAASPDGIMTHFEVNRVGASDDLKDEAGMREEDGKAMDVIFTSMLREERIKILRRPDDRESRRLTVIEWSQVLATYQPQELSWCSHSLSNCEYMNIVVIHQILGLANKGSSLSYSYQRSWFWPELVKGASLVTCLFMVSENSSKRLCHILHIPLVATEVQFLDYFDSNLQLPSCSHPIRFLPPAKRTKIKWKFKIRRISHDILRLLGLAQQEIQTLIHKVSKQIPG